MTTTDPYAPARKLARQPVARRAPRNPPVLRMRRVGVTPDEEREALQAWAEWTDDEKFEFLESWDHLSDAEIRTLLTESRTEDPYVDEPVADGHGEAQTG